MKRLLVVAEDRALTRFVADALLGRSATTTPPRPTDPWDIARAHKGLEAFLLVTRGGRPFDVVLIDQALPDQEPLELVDKLRRHEASAEVPIFLLSERGRDQHSRRIASDRYNVAGFVEKPVTVESVRAALETLERRRRVLLVEPRAEPAERFHDALTKAGYLVERATLGRQALDRAPRFRPDVVIAALELEDLRGADVCVELKRSRAEINVPVVLYGQASALASQEIAENAHRADDFVQAPFDEGVLVERVAALVGRGIIEPPPPRWFTGPPPSLASGAEAPGVSREAPGLTVEGAPHSSGRLPSLAPGLASIAEAASAHGRRSSRAPSPASSPASSRAPSMSLPTANLDTPPPSASPAAVGPTKRSTRRVPCQISMSVRNGERTYTSKTLDISHGGIFLAIDGPLAVGTLIDMTFQIPNNPRVVNAVGKVAWAGHAPDAPGTSGGAGVGVKFAKIDPSDLQLIVDYVNRVSRVVYSAS